MITLTAKEKDMSRRDARMERQRLNTIVSNCYDEFESDDRELRDKLREHMDRCKKAEHDRTMHIMFMHAMGWI